MRKPKILFLSSDKYPPFRTDVKVLFGKELAAKGYTIDWVLQAEEHCEESYTTTWLQHRVFVGRSDSGKGFWSRVKKHLYDLHNDVKLFKLARSEKYQTILVKDKYVTAVFALLAAKIFGIKFIFWLSYPFPESRIYQAGSGTAARYPFLYLVSGLLYKFLQYKVIMAYANFIFVQSEQMEIDVEAHGISSDKIAPVLMGVELEEIDEVVRQNEKVQPLGKKVCYVGTLIRVRRLDFLVRVFAEVISTCADAELVIVGGGDSEEDVIFLKKEAEMLGIADSVTFTGQLPWAEAVAVAQACLVCVSPFFPTFILNSTSPTKLIEYWAMSKPVVATDHPEQRKVISESGGGVCVPYDESLFAAAIAGLLKSPQKAVEMGRLGRKYVERERTYKIIADRLDRQLMRILNQ